MNKGASKCELCGYCDTKNASQCLNRWQECKHCWYTGHEAMPCATIATNSTHPVVVATNESTREYLSILVGRVKSAKKIKKSWDSNGVLLLFLFFVQ